MTAALSSFFALLVGGVPVAFALGTCGLIYLLLQGAAAPTLAAQMFSSLNSSGLLAIPFFILAAEIMSRSGATIRLINLIDTLLRHTRGGLPVISVLATALFSSICGSSVATAAAMGTVLIPEMTKRGYDRLFAVGLIATAGGLGILIPPSVPLVVYGMVTETSIAALFAAGGAVGLVLTLLLSIVAYIYGRRSGVAPRPRATREEIRKAFVSGLGVLMSPVIVLGGIYGGIFTPMEAAAVSCVYAIFLAVLYGQSLKEMLPMLTSAASMSSVIMLILAGAQLFGYLLTNERVPHEMFVFISSLELSRNELIIAIMLFFLIAGMFLEVISMILITMPILLPVLAGFDINLVFFAVLLVLNMEIAIITPPIGLNLFTISAITKIPVMRVFRGCIPFVIILAVFLAFMALTPGIQTFFELL
ncbi:MAG: TRAP transporter large permease [Burkholderiaceae bacterium]|nr:TRAP transporter large permease [Burkholderiaceae bacterium]MCD8538072.1 TRAP transporter large permease [Burkholderiaceae bacterium]